MKLRPFSHKPGTLCWIPFSSWIVEVFPAMLKVGESSFPLGLTGPIKEFTVQLDLEKDCVWVWGIAHEGHYRFSLQAEAGALLLRLDRAPKEGLQIGPFRLMAKESLPLLKGLCFAKPTSSLERLTLGSWKMQEVERMWQGPDLHLLAPILFLLGQKVEGEGELLEVPLDHFVLTSMKGLFVPHEGDPLYQGITPPQKQSTPFALLRGAYLSIRGKLLQEEGVKTCFLPQLPSDWQTGKASHFQTAKGEVDFEWSQGKINRVFFRPSQSGEVCFSFPREIQTFRCGGKVFENGACIALKEGEPLFLDRFQK
jgi:hypothetical protein